METIGVIGVLLLIIGLGFVFYKLLRKKIEESNRKEIDRLNEVIKKNSKDLDYYKRTSEVHLENLKELKEFVEEKGLAEDFYDWQDYKNNNYKDFF